MNLPLAKHIYPNTTTKNHSVFYLVPEYKTCFIEKPLANQFHKFDNIDGFGLEGYFNPPFLIKTDLMVTIGLVNDPIYVFESKHNLKRDKPSIYNKIAIILLAIMCAIALFFIFKRRF